MLDKLLSKMRQYFSDCPCFKEGGCLCPEVDPNKIKPVKMPSAKMMFVPFNMLLDNGKNFLLLALPFALLLTVLAMASGAGYMCIYAKIAPVNAFCNESAIVFFIFQICKIFLWSVFAIKWCESSLLKQPLRWPGILRVDSRSVKLTAVLILAIVLNFLPIISAWILNIRIPNPDWRIELIFFAFVSIGFLIPFVVMRFYSVIPFIIYGERIPPLKEIWYKTTGDLLIILLSLFFIFIIAVFVLGNLYSNFQTVAIGSTFYINFASEFIYNLIVLLILTLTINNFCFQQQLLFGNDEENENAGK